MAISNRTVIYPEDRWPKQIGERYHPTGKFLSYSDIIKDDEAWEYGWIKASRYLPKDLELCMLKGTFKDVVGWWDGSSWKGYRVHKGQKFTLWKKTPNPHGVYGNHLVRKE